MFNKECTGRKRTVGKVAAVLAVIVIAGGAVVIGTSNGLFAGTASASLRPASAVSTSLPVSFADMVQRVSPAVVNIQVTADGPATPANMQGPGSGAPGDLPEFFRRFFGDQVPQRFRGGPRPQERQGQRMHGLGSGFIIDKDGYIVTNDHVVGEADKIVVTLQNGEKHKATLIGRDRKTDLALIKISADKSLPFVAFGDSRAMRVGDWVVAVGNPFGLDHTVTAGIISARGRAIGNGPYDDFLQIDAPINKGNSGGPAFNLQGQVIGINTAIFSPTGGSVGIGFAIPSSLAQQVIAELRANGKVERGWLGVSIQAVTRDMAASLNLDKPKGAIVAKVTPDSPAAKAGIKQGDVILSVDGKPVATVRVLPRLIAGIEAGKTAGLTVWRDGREKTLRVNIGRMPNSAEIASVTKAEVEGMRLSRLDPALRRSYGIGENVKGVVIIGVAPDSWAAEQGLSEGDVIVSVANTGVSSPADVAAEIGRARKEDQKAVLLLVKRQTEERFVALPLKAA